MPRQEPLVSVVIPVWNTGESVKKLINELFEQTYQNLEIIAVDDGSSDNSLRILRKLKRSDSRLKVVHQKNAGVSAARNAGIDIAQGKYITFVDSDDEVMKDFVEKMLQRVGNGREIALVSTGIRHNKLRIKQVLDIYTEPHRKRRENESKVDYILDAFWRDGRLYGVIGKMFRLEPIKKYDLKFEVGRNFAEDTNFILKYLKQTSGEIEFVLEPLYMYNFGTETSIVRSSSVIWKNWKRSHQDLKAWAVEMSEGRLGLKARILLVIVLLRWRVSHYRAKKRARA